MAEKRCDDAVGVRRFASATASGVQVPTGIITRGYRLHGVTSFPIRRAKFHAWPVPCLSRAQRLSMLCGTTFAQWKRKCAMVTRAFTSRQSESEPSDRIPLAPHLVDNSPVLTAGATPRIEAADWTFTIKVGPRPVKAWSWSEFNAFPRTKMQRDIPFVTSWSKLSTAWEGVTFPDILAHAGAAGDLVEIDIELLRQLRNSTAAGARDGRSARSARHHHSHPLLNHSNLEGRESLWIERCNPVINAAE